LAGDYNVPLDAATAARREVVTTFLSFGAL